MSLFFELIFSVFSLIIGGILIIKYREKIKHLKTNDMLWATGINLLMGGILLFLLGIVAFVDSIIKLFYFTY